MSFDAEVDRVRNVITKLGRGHALFELGEPQFSPPSHFGFQPIELMSIEIRKRFEEPPESSIWPEVGSRAMQRIVTGEDMDSSGWIVVQPGRYRYIAQASGLITVRMVIGEYLAAEVIWGSE